VFGSCSPSRELSKCDISPFLTVGENVNEKIFRVRVRVMFSRGTVLTVTRT
jgi:hypothetical protein